jgi:hypothetical protein
MPESTDHDAATSVSKLIRRARRRVRRPTPIPTGRTEGGGTAGCSTASGGRTSGVVYPATRPSDKARWCAHWRSEPILAPALYTDAEQAAVLHSGEQAAMLHSGAAH